MMRMEAFGLIVILLGGTVPGRAADTVGRWIKHEKHFASDIS